MKKLLGVEIEKYSVERAIRVPALSYTGNRETLQSLLANRRKVSRSEGWYLLQVTFLSDAGLAARDRVR